MELEYGEQGRQKGGDQGPNIRDIAKNEDQECSENKNIYPKQQQYEIAHKPG